MPSESKSVRIVLGVLGYPPQAVALQLVLPSGGFRVDLSAQQITSCTPSTGTFGCYGCDVGWTEGACVHLSTDAGLAISFYVPHVLCLTEETASVECPTEKVANIIGVSAALIGARLRLCGQRLRSHSL